MGGGHWGPHFSLGGRGPAAPLRRTAPGHQLYSLIHSLILIQTARPIKQQRQTER